MMKLIALIVLTLPGIAAAGVADTFKPTHAEKGRLQLMFLQWSAVVQDAERAAVESARLFGNAIRTRRAVLRADPFK